MFKLFKSRRGELRTIVTIAIGLLLGAILAPIAIDQIMSTTTTSWNPAVVTIFQILLPILAVLAIALIFFRKVTSGRGELRSIVTIVIGMLLVALLFPVAMSEIVAMNVTGWNTAVVTIVKVLLPVLAVIAVALLFLRKVKV